MQFSHDFDEDIIARFFATVHLEKKGAHTMTWMTKYQLMPGTWEQFG
jgi:hypothetical protein